VAVFSMKFDLLASNLPDPSAATPPPSSAEFEWNSLEFRSSSSVLVLELKKAPPPRAAAMFDVNSEPSTLCVKKATPRAKPD